jgi:Uma2 family endonuclease
MTEPARRLSHTFAEYVAQEAKSETKHEYVNGEIFAMAGGTLEHGRLCASIIGELCNALRGRPCVVFSSDVRVRVRATALCTYPDASVVCGRPEVDPEDKNTLLNPVVIVEVLSDSTEAYDRDDKRAHYRRIPSLRHYLLVSQHERRIDHYQRNKDGTWALRDAGEAGHVRLEAVGCEIAVDAVYEDPLAALPAPAARSAPAAARPRKRPAGAKPATSKAEAPAARPKRARRAKRS